MKPVINGVIATVISLMIFSPMAFAVKHSGVKHSCVKHLGTCKKDSNCCKPYKCVVVDGKHTCGDPDPTPPTSE